MDEARRAAEVERINTGDADALQRLIVCYHGVLRGFVAGAIPTEMAARIDADDVLQDAYVVAFKAVAGEDRPSFDSVGGFYKWLETVVLSRLRDQQRALHRQKRDVAREACGGPVPASYPDVIDRLAGDQSTPSRHMAREEAAAAVVSCLARLNEDQRAVVRLRFFEGRPVAEIAGRLERTEAAVHMLCHRGLKALRGHLESLSRFMSGH